MYIYRYKYIIRESRGNTLLDLSYNLREKVKEYVGVARIPHVLLREKWQEQRGRIYIPGGYITVQTS